MDVDVLKRILIDKLRIEQKPIGTDIGLSGPIHTGKYGMIFRAITPAAPFPLAVKICKCPETGAPDTLFSKHQYESLCQAFSAMSRDPLYGVPKPIALLDDDAIIVMEWV